jgi:uncharacterized surface protein with fasciclin (FAS1) repeats
MQRIVSVAALLAGLACLLSAHRTEAADNAEMNIVQTAVANGHFKTLARALEAAGLVETLEGKGPFTVFAPTDEAFAKIPEEKLAELLKDKKALTAVLLYHVVKGDVTAAKVVKMNSAKTVEGQPVTIEDKEGTVMINDAKVVKADVMCTNGVIHVIDAVLLPPAAK